VRQCRAASRRRQRQNDQEIESGIEKEKKREGGKGVAKERGDRGKGRDTTQSVE
jgi:hypothetical protein